MAIAYHSGGSAAVASGGSVVVTMSSTASNGDYLIAAAAIDANTGTRTWPSGFTERGIITANIDGGEIAWADKIAGASEPATYTLNYSQSSQASSFAVVGFSGVDTTTPRDVTPTASANNPGSTTSPWNCTGPGVATGSANRWLVWIGGVDNATSGLVTSAVPSASPATWTERIDQSSSNFANIAVCDCLDTAGTYTTNVTGVQTLSGSAGAMAFLIALRAATGGAQSYSYTAVGGLQTGGAATKVKGRVPAASGGLQTGGSSTEVRGHVPSASGGIQTGGAATKAAGKVPAISGGILLSGSSAEIRGRVPSVSGGIQTGGAATEVRGKVPTTSGGLQFGGHANMSSSGLQSYIYSADGGLSLSGFAATIRTIGQTASGGVVLSGAATILPTYMTQTVARPTTDTTPGAWLPSTGTDLFAMVDEVVADDADYIYATSASACKLALSAVSDPLTSSGQVVSYRAWSPTGGGLIVRLKQGATTIATWTHATLPTTATTFNQALTAGECDSITDYAALSVEMESTV